MIEIIPKTAIDVHFKPDADEELLARTGFFSNPDIAYVCLGDDGMMEVFYQRYDGCHRPTDVRFSGLHKIFTSGSFVFQAITGLRVNLVFLYKNFRCFDGHMP